jgi:hypothetical protein
MEGEKRDLDRVRPVERHVGVDRSLVSLGASNARDPPRRQHDDQRPPDADQQPVAARHVGERERRVLVRVLTGLQREREVDRVLRQDRDERQHR